MRNLTGGVAVGIVSICEHFSWPRGMISCAEECYLRVRRNHRDAASVR